jgi:segregation and condensation protein A
LGVLLELVEHRQLEVTSISVADITAGYLERIHRLEAGSPDELGEFLALGARLLYIKSLALLPTATADEQEELRTLNLELDDYKQFQAAARELVAREPSRTWPRPASQRLESATLTPPANLELSALTEALARVLQAVPTSTPNTLIRVSVSQQTILARLRHRLQRGFELETALRDCGSRLEVVVTFLALLELIRNGDAQVEQIDQFGSVQVNAA